MKKRKMKDINYNIASLKEPSTEATKEEATKIWKDLKQVLANHKDGVGLSAVQLNPSVYKRVAMIKTIFNEYHLLNPRIVKMDDQFLFLGEGCLSLPGVRKNTVRYKHIVVEDDNLGKVCFDSHIDPLVVVVAIQHEIDHLNGILFTERVQKAPIIESKTKKVGRNDPCPCGSGKKYKKCCMRKKRNDRTI